MSKDIWHTPPEQPDPFKSWNVLVVYEANDRKEMMYSTQFIHATDGMYVNRWCYLDDLIALETENKDVSDKIGKLETELEKTHKELEQSETCCTEWEKQALDYKAENIALSGKLERTHKALDVAVDTLHWYDDNYDSVVARNTLDEIKTALKQKDVK